MKDEKAIRAGEKVEAMEKRENSAYKKVNE